MDKKKAALLGLTLILKLRNKKRRRRLWKKEWLQRDRGISGNYGILNELQFHLDFNTFLRIDRIKFSQLLKKIYPFIVKMDTNMRVAITPKEKLVCTLRFLATGESFTSLAFQTRISKQAISNFVPDVCNSIYNVLHEEFLQVRFKDYDLICF